MLRVVLLGLLRAAAVVGTPAKMYREDDWRWQEHERSAGFVPHHDEAAVSHRGPQGCQIASKRGKAVWLQPYVVIKGHADRHAYDAELRASLALSGKAHFVRLLGYDTGCRLLYSSWRRTDGSNTLECDASLGTSSACSGTHSGRSRLPGFHSTRPTFRSRSPRLSRLSTESSSSRPPPRSFLRSFVRSI